MIFPSGLTNVGSSILRSVNATVYSRTLEEDLLQLNANFLTAFTGNIIYGNDLVYQLYTDPVTNEQGLTLASWQNIDLYANGFDEGTTLIVESWRSGNVGNRADGVQDAGKVLNIEDFAFADCNAESIIIRNAEGYNHTVNLESFAFALTKAKNISVEVNVTFGGCVAEGTLITLADGKQVPVEQLKGDENLLVWNLNTGKFDIAPILFIDKDPANTYEVVNLSFSDGTNVKVISEHGFWDITLNKYVYLDNNASQYIGHWFNKQITDENGKMSWTKVQLIDVTISEEFTTSWSPVTYGHLCYYVNGMLSMPGGINGMFNIFEVGEDMKYDIEAMEKDIETYGLYTYEEFAEILPVPEEMFNAVSGQYLKVAIGKGLITIEDIQKLINRYGVFFE